MTVHLLDTHPGRHRAQPSRPHPLRALLDALELLTRWWNWPPVQAWYTRQYRRADRKALAAEMAAAPHIPAHASTERIYAGGRNLGTQPRRTPYPSAADPMVPLVTDDDPPWDIQTAQQPALDEGGYACCGHCDEPEPQSCVPPDSHQTPCADGCNDAPVYGQAPQLVVEPDLAKVMIP